MWFFQTLFYWTAYLATEAYARCPAIVGMGAHGGSGIFFPLDSFLPDSSVCQDTETMGNFLSPKCQAGAEEFLVQMSERLQELERAVTVDPLEGSSDGERREEAGLSRRALSVGLVRKSSLSIRRTLSSFKCAPPSFTPFNSGPSGGSVPNNRFSHSEVRMQHPWPLPMHAVHRHV